MGVWLKDWEWITSHTGFQTSDLLPVENLNLKILKVTLHKDSQLSRSCSVYPVFKIDFSNNIFYTTIYSYACGLNTLTL